MSIDEAHHFRTALLSWHAGCKRPLPWKGERDPYRIWLSEVVLQQTRVEQGMPYYERLASAYPTVEALAQAPLDELLKHWQGLGYYSRARNLHAAAQEIANKYGGVFPSTFEGIRSLRGVGDYTAAAVGSFAFGLPHAVLDGNVYRVLARFWGIETPVNTPKGREQFAALAQTLLDTERPGAYNQAIMDFGATLCRPRRPLCGECPLSDRCVAFRQGRITELPQKKPGRPRQSRFFLYAVFLQAGRVWMQQRLSGDIWANLYEFARVETDALPSDVAAAAAQLKERFFPGGAPVEWRGVYGPYRQALSHRIVHALFYVFEGSPAEPIAHPPVDTTACAAGWWPIEEVDKKVPLPKIIAQFWRKKVLSCRTDESNHQYKLF